MSELPAAPPPPDVPGDIPAAEFRAAMHRVADIVADYLEHVGAYPVLPRIAPGEVRRALPAAPPEEPEPLEAILADYRRLIEPNVTHWNHPGFLAYFAITGSGPGILGETLAAGLNVNAMLWRTGPAATELEEVVCDWLRQLLSLPAGFVGHINDTASVSSFLALAAARHRLPGLAIRERGMAGRRDLPPLVVYASEQAHSSIDKAVMALGIGHANLRKVETDDEYRMGAASLEAAIAADRAAGRLPAAVVATAGTTSTTSVDPLRAVAGICRREGIWLHVDAAYAGSAAICPEFRALFDGIGEADSIVVNPHKWLFTPVDCSVLFVRDPGAFREAFAHVPEYLRTAETGVTNLMDYGIQMGRRFRALKLWMVMRAFGAEGLRARIRAHCALAREFAAWVEREPGFALSAPVPFSTVCFRAVGAAGPAEQDAMNERLLSAINAAGSVFLSHTTLRGRYVLRLAIGNLRTGREHLERAWALIRSLASELGRTADA
ncbi:MAG: amino acid decarboxylase [Gemmatimonadetes bacterium]|nr:amino acid decarboxylase [Gemmatimonadota bacterium]